MCFITWCAFSPLSQSVSSTASELTNMLNSHAYAHAASTDHLELTSFNVPVHPPPFLRCTLTFSPQPLNSTLSCLQSSSRLPIGTSFISFNSSAALWNPPVLLTERIFAFTSERPAAPLTSTGGVAARASTAASTPHQPSTVRIATLRPSLRASSRTHACATRATATTTASAAVSPSRLLLVASRATNSLSPVAASAPPQLNTTITTRPSPVAPGAAQTHS
eukprot:1271597-Pleurochrysis_carterae.AAC.1